MTSFSISLLAALSVLILVGCDSASDESCLNVTPNESYALSGTAMTMDFSPDAKTYTVRNTCDTGVMLSVVEDVRWLDVEIETFGGGGNESGMLNTDTSISVVIEVRYGSDNLQRLDQLTPGTYVAELRFEDNTNNTQIVYSVDLTINTP